MVISLQPYHFGMLAHPSFPLIADEQLKSSQAHSFIQCYHLWQKQNNNICRWWHCTAWSTWIKALTGWPNCFTVARWSYATTPKEENFGAIVSLQFYFNPLCLETSPFTAWQGRKTCCSLEERKTQIKCEWGSSASDLASGVITQCDVFKPPLLGKDDDWVGQFHT